MRSVDVHQHLWLEAVLRVLERRGVPPKATWRSDRWHVELPTEPGFDVHPSDHDPAERARGLRVDRALVALSPPAGLDALPARDALAVVAAWQEAVRALPPELGWWASTPGSLPADAEAELAREAIADGAAGLCLSAPPAERRRADAGGGRRCGRPRPDPPRPRCGRPRDRSRLVVARHRLRGGRRRRAAAPPTSRGDTTGGSRMIEENAGGGLLRRTRP